MYKAVSNIFKEYLNKVLLSNNNINYIILDTSDNLTIILPYLSFFDFILILVFRFLGIRCIIFIYILLLHKQCQSLCNILKINDEHIKKVHEVLTKI